MTKTPAISAGALVLAVVIGFSTPVIAEMVTNGSITVHSGPKKKFDRKIEAAAIAKAAERIGELRGSVSGDAIGEIIRESDLDGSRSSGLGFPIIEETGRLISTAPEGAVPLV